MATEAESQLFETILPFWNGIATDKEYGGFYGCITNDNRVDTEADKGLVMHSRLLWSFSAVRRFRDEAMYSQSGGQALTFLRDKLADPVHGGYWWTCDSRGNPADRNKVVYGQAFALYGLSEVLRVEENPGVRKDAEAVFALIEKFARDGSGGYLEILSEDWSRHPEGRLSSMDIPCFKSMNTNLHVLEAYTNYFRVLPDSRVYEALHSLVRWFAEFIYDSKRRHLTLFLNEKAQSIKDVDSYGHDIEAAWLLREAVRVLGDRKLEAEVEPMLAQLTEAVFNEGFSLSDGGLDFERDTDHRDTDRHWWVQAEAVVGFRDRWEVDNDERWAEASQRTWRFILKKLVDESGGEWLWGVDDTGKPMEKEKAGLWKTPYHNGRACMELIERIAGEPAGKMERI